MAETPKPDLPDKDKPTVNSDPAIKAQPALDKPTTPPPEKQTEPPTVGGGDHSAPGQKPPEPPVKAAPAPKEPSRDQEAGPKAPVEKEQPKPDAQRKPVDRPQKSVEKPAQPDKPAAKRGRPKAAEKPVAKAAPVKKPPRDAESPINPMPEKRQVDAPRSKEPEQIVYLKLEELHPFKEHPFGVRDDSEMRALVESVKDKGVNQPALVRPRPDGEGYEIIAGHRRQRASEVAGFKDMPCIVRNMTDDEAILAMTDDNLRQRSEILPSERAISLKMQVEAIKHQGARTSGQNVQNSDAGKRSVDIVGERNDMNPKQVQRYVRLTELVPDLLKAVDEKRLSFTPAVEMSYVRPKNQRLIAVSIEGEQSSPSLSQAKKMRELDQQKLLNADVIDGILCEEKKEVDKVILSGAELTKYFGAEKTPREMKDQILKLLDDWKEKQPVIEQQQKKTDLEK